MTNRLHPIPKPPGKPLLGNALAIDGETPIQSLMGLTRELGPIYWLDMMGAPVVIVSGPELVNELCDESRFDKSVRGALRKVRAVGGDGLFTSDTDAPNWSKAHNILLPTFSQQAMVEYLPMMVDIAEQLLLKWERLNAGEPIDVVRDMTGLTLDTVGLCGFDYRFNSFYREDFHPFIGALTRTLETCMLQRNLPFEGITLRKRLTQQEEDVAYMYRLVDEIIADRRRRGGDQKDLLNFMLAGEDKKTGERLSDENIRYQINTFLIAGHETTSGLLSFALHYLIEHPEALAKATAEVDTVLGHDIARAPTISELGQLQYVRAVLMEALRLWPTAPAFSLSPYEDELIGGRYPLKKGAFITVLIPMLHRDESVWGDNSEAFDPDRFLPEAERARPAYAYKPFGNGQRACIGRQFAMQEAILVLGMILQRFELFGQGDYKLQIKETLSVKPEGFYIRVKQRPEAVRGSGGAEFKEPETASAALQRPKHDTPLHILYGSNLGATENLARELAHAGDINGFATTLAPLDDYADGLPREGAVIIATASYNGTPPDNAARFVASLDAAAPGSAAGVTYAVFGCGNREWASTYQSVPRHIDERLHELGATRFTQRAEADAREGIDGTFHDWQDALWPELGTALDLQIDLSEAADTPPLYSVEVAQSINANPVAMRAGTSTVTVVANRELQSGDDRSTRHIEFELPEGMTYEPGDHLCVVGRNGESTIRRAMTRFGFDDNSYIRVDVHGGRRSPFPSGSTFSVRRLAEVFGELQAVASTHDVETLLKHTQCPDTRRKLEAILADQKLFRDSVFLKRKSVLDLLEEFPACELPFEIYMEMVPWMTPRYYSISSSPLATPGRCSITVGVVEGDALSGLGTYSGVCSTTLRDAVAGDTVAAAIKSPATPFRLPDDSTRPIIMIGPGTGVAPFMGFIKERAARRAAGSDLGEALLFFGCRHPQQDFLYADELKEADKDGNIELHTAFSREGESRHYVQDEIKRVWPRVWSLIQADAVIYVCGDGAVMEPDVKRTLSQLYMDESGVGAEQAQAWLDDLARGGRYVLDVWAG